MSRRRFLPSALASIVAAALVVSAMAVHAQDQQPPPADWVATGLTRPTFDLFTPTSGAFFAVTIDGFQRSDDGGATWRLVSLPFPRDFQAAAARGEQFQVAVTPTNHTILYVAGPDGVYRTRDDAQTWTLIYPTPSNRVLKIAVSPADPNLVYLALTGAAIPSSQYLLLKSRDGGTTFETVWDAHPSTCGMTVSILMPDMANAATLYEASACISGRTSDVGVVVSHDQGKTLQASFHEPLEYANRLVGGAGVDPTRLYLTSTRDARAGGGSTLWRSDDGAQSWTSVLVSRPESDTQVSIADLAYDPAGPDHVWIATTDGVLESLDGGQTWQDDGAHDLAVASRLVLGIDGRHLYLANDQGVWQQSTHISSHLSVSARADLLTDYATSPLAGPP